MYWSSIQWVFLNPIHVLKYAVDAVWTHRQSIKIWTRDWTAFFLSHLLIFSIYLSTYIILSDYISWWWSKVYILHLSYLLFQSFVRSYYPPGPPPMAILGNSPFINVLAPETTFLEYREIYGPVFTLHLSKPTVILANFESCKEALVHNSKKTEGRSSSESFVLFTGDRVNGDGVILAMGEKWRTMKDEIKKFMGGKYRSGQMDESVLRHTSELEEELKALSKEGAQIDLREPLSGAIANVIQEVTIGKTFKYQEEEFQTQLSNINTVVKEIMTPEVFFVNCYPWLRFLPDGILRGWTSYKKSGFRLQEWFKTILHEHQKTPEEQREGDFMSHMIEQSEEGRQYSDLSIILTCGDMWTGGMETTTTTLRWGIIYLLQNPEVQNKCREEIKKVFGDVKPDMTRMKETPFVQATLSEIQRLANVLPWAIPHKTFEPTRVGDHTIPIDTEIIPALGALLCDPLVFQNPKEFQPERFLDEFGKYKKIDEFSPFGMGPRRCLGENLARTELYLIFTRLLQQFEFYLKDSDPIPVAERVIGGITAPPKPYTLRVKYLGEENLQ